MIDYSIRIVSSNSEGSMLRCPKCGQVLCVVNEVFGSMKVTVQCRRCKTFSEISSDYPHMDKD